MREQSERLIDVMEIGRRLGCGRTHVHNMVKRGEFPEPLRMGRNRRWRESTVDRWIRALAGEDAPSSTNAPAPDRETAAGA